MRCTHPTIKAAERLEKGEEIKIRSKRGNLKNQANHQTTMKAKTKTELVRWFFICSLTENAYYETV